ncbi:hypothetical protein E2C01_024194 [Portunus trituberculatus]|uniref:Uncharacterized protein n=1 Tax=Portunus trituberculatus TaxID=210409 RepID=A0A5B7ED69_PORTR|nr:hypothetical protein [Portunus trituberculatus]
MIHDYAKPETPVAGRHNERDTENNSAALSTGIPLSNIYYVTNINPPPCLSPSLSPSSLPCVPLPILPTLPTCAATQRGTKVSGVPAADVLGSGTTSVYQPIFPLFSDFPRLPICLTLIFHSAGSERQLYREVGQAR